MARQNKKRKKRISKIGIFFGVVLLIITVLFFSLLKMLNILPSLLFFGIICIISFITALLFFVLIIKPKRGKIFLMIIQGFCYIVSLALIGIYCFGAYYLNETMHFIDNISVMKEEVTNYYVIVLKDKKYQEISDLDKKTMAYFANTDKNILDKIKLNLDYKSTYDISELNNMLINGDVESIFISDIIKNKLEDDYVDFNTNVRILETLSITSKIEDITKTVSMKNTPFNVLISGIDSYGDINKNSRSDVNIIATVNPNTDEILLTSIPRDYYVPLYEKKGNKDKLTHASYYGINTQVKTIENIFDIDINYYVKVNFSTLVELVDAIGGIRVYSDQYVYLPTGPCTLTKGYHNIDGGCALAFARERYSYADGDKHRGKNQQEVIKAIFNKLVSGGTLISEYTDILAVLDGKFATNVDMDEVINLLKYEVDDLGNYYFKSIQVDGYGSMGETYSYPGQELWVMIPYENTINDAKTIMGKILNDKSVRD